MDVLGKNCQIWKQISQRVGVFETERHGCCIEKDNMKPNKGFFCGVDDPQLLSKNKSPIFNLLNIISGKTTSFMGNSLTVTIFNTIEMELMANNIKHTSLWIAKEKIVKIQTLGATNVTTTLKLIYFFNLGHPVDNTDCATLSSDDVGFLDTTLLPRLFESSNIIITNIGLH